MQDLKKKIAVELLLHPQVVITSALGASALLLYPITGVGAIFGSALLLISVGLFFTNMIFNIDKISAKVLSNIKKQEKQKRDKDINGLYDSFRKTQGNKDDNILRDLCGLHEAFHNDLDAGTIHAPSAAIDLIDDLFDACIEKLKTTYSLYQSAVKVTGDIKKRMLDQRKDMLDDIQSNLENLSNAIQEARVLNIKSNKSDLRDLSNRLKSQLAAAKATEEILSDLSMDRFSEYE